MSAPRLLLAASDVDDTILAAVTDTVEAWFTSEGPMPEEDLIDRLCADHAAAGGWDIEDMATPAVRKIVRHARAIRREM